MNSLSPNELRAEVAKLRSNLESMPRSERLAILAADERRRYAGEPLHRYTSTPAEKANAELRAENLRLRQENAALIAKLGQVNALVVKVQTKLDQIKQKKK